MPVTQLPSHSARRALLDPRRSVNHARVWKYCANSSAPRDVQLLSTLGIQLPSRRVSHQRAAPQPLAIEPANHPIDRQVMMPWGIGRTLGLKERTCICMCPVLVCGVVSGAA